MSRALLVASLFACTHVSSWDARAPSLESRRTSNAELDVALAQPHPERAALAVARIGDVADLPAVQAALAVALARSDCAGASMLTFALTRLAPKSAPLDIPSPFAPTCRVPSLARAAAMLGGAEQLRTVAEWVKTAPPDIAEAAALGLGVRARTAAELVATTTATALAEALSRPEPNVRTAAAYGLERLGAGQTREALEKALNDTSPQVRAHAARALGEIAGGPPGPLLTLLADADWHVRVQAARGLGLLAKRGEVSVAQLSSAAAGAIDEAADGRGASAHVAVTLAEALEQLPPNSARSHLDRLAAAASHASNSAGIAVSCAFARASDRASGALARVPSCAASNEPSFRSRIRNAEVLGLLSARDSATALEALSALLSDEDSRVRAAAAQALSSAQGDVASLFTRALADGDPFVIAAAADAAKDRKDVAAFAPALGAALIRFSSAHNDSAGTPASDALVTLVGSLGPAVPDGAPLLLRLLPAGSLQLDRGIRESLAALHASPVALIPPALETPSLPVFEARSLVLHTSRGAIRVALAQGPLDAPLNVRNIVALATRHFYDGTTFHRVVPDFVAQGGDPRGDGSGGPGYAVPDELTPTPYERGTVGIALAWPDSAGSQFFVCHSAAPHLDGRYTVIGQVEDGMDVADALQIGDRITSVDVVK